jgi:hypothetical protein
MSKCPHCGRDHSNITAEEIIQSVIGAFAFGAIILDWGDKGSMTYARDLQTTITFTDEDTN